MWDLEARRKYLIKLGFDGGKVNSKPDTWVLMMTSHLAY